MCSLLARQLLAVVPGPAGEILHIGALQVEVGEQDYLLLLELA